VVNRRNRAPSLVRVPCAVAGKDLCRFVTMATNTWFKIGF